MAEQAMVVLEQGSASGHQAKVVQLPRNESIESVQARWQALVDRIPLLGARVRRMGDGLAFAPGPRSVPIPVRQTSLSPVGILEEALSTTIDAERGPLARAVLFRKDDGTRSRREYLLLQCHHCVADGAARDELCRAVLGRGRRVTSKYWDDLGPAEDHVGPPDTEERARLIDAFVRRQLELGSESSIRFAPIFRGNGRGSAVISVPISIGHRAFSDRAKHHGSSMHGAVAASLLMASFPTLRDQTGAPPDAGVLLLSSSRPRLRDGRTAPFGMYGSGVRTRHRLSPRTDFWALARHVYSEVRGARHRGEDVAALHLQHLARRSTDPPTAIAPLWLTTLRWNCPVYAIGGVAVHTQGPLIYCGALVGMRQTVLNFLYPKPFMDPATVHAIAEETIMRLCRALDAPTTHPVM